jgi:hypothetical protein
MSLNTSSPLFSDKKARGDGLNVFSELHLALTSEYIQRLFHIIMLMQLDSLAEGTMSTLSSYLRSDETFSRGYSSGHDFSRPLPVCFPPKNLQKPAAIHCCPSFHKYIKSCKYRPRGDPILGRIAFWFVENADAGSTKQTHASWKRRVRVQSPACFEARNRNNGQFETRIFTEKTNRKRVTDTHCPFIDGVKCGWENDQRVSAW